MPEYRYAEVFVTFLSPEDGGQNHSFSLNDVGYRAQVRITPDGETFDVAFVDGPDELQPRGQTFATIQWLATSMQSDERFTVGRHFEILDGLHIVGRGTVTRR
jgi:hypothetical protein